MRTPCEGVVKLVLPGFRSLIAKNLIEKYNFSQVTAAKKLGTTQATISHYLYSKRGVKILKQLESIDSVRSLADQIATRIATQNLSPVEAMLKFCELCKMLRTKDMICDIHKRFIALPEKCELCHS
jgi:predicted transcriptional regulator